MDIRVFRILYLVAILAVIEACSSVPPPLVENSNAGRYSIMQDRAPEKPIDIGSIREVVPVPVVRTIAGNRSPYTVLGKSYFVLPSEEGYSERGIASWYGEKFHGHKTSNGEVFDMYQVSAAHKSLPIPTFLKVTNLDNNRSIIVRVNDRGPFHGNRVIDLSYAAALKLGYADIGTARVQLDAIITEELSSGLVFRGDTELKALPSASRMLNNQYLQIAALSNQASASKLLTNVAKVIDQPVFINTMKDSTGKTLFRVRIGPIDDPAELENISRELEAADFGMPYPVRQ
tara:strand:- start:172 stop:1038 length:867 start_codon:yes stop_codon:yes gene_type:complete